MVGRGLATGRVRDSVSESRIFPRRGYDLCRRLHSCRYEFSAISEVIGVEAQPSPGRRLCHALTGPMIATATQGVALGWYVLPLRGVGGAGRDVELPWLGIGANPS
jgi:hypothetical protein